METVIEKESRFHLSEKVKEIIVGIISLLFVCLFIYTAVSKFITHDKFVWALGMSPYIDEKAELVGWAIPAIEILISGLLMYERSRKKGLISSLVLMTLFTIYLIFMVATVGKLPCTCGGVISEMTWNQHIGFNIFCMCLAAAGIGLSSKRVPIIKCYEKDSI